MYQHYNPYTGQIQPGIGAYASPYAVEANLLDPTGGMGGLGEECTIEKFLTDNKGIITAIVIGWVALKFINKHTR